MRRLDLGYTCAERFNLDIKSADRSRVASGAHLDRTGPVMKGAQQSRFKSFQLRVDSRFKSFELRVESRFESFELRFENFELRVKSRFQSFELRVESRFERSELRVESRFESSELCGQFRVELRCKPLFVSFGQAHFLSIMIAQPGD